MPLVHALLQCFLSVSVMERFRSRGTVVSTVLNLPDHQFRAMYYGTRKIIKTHANKWRALVVKKKTYSLDEKRVLIRLIISNDKTYFIVNTNHISRNLWYTGRAISANQNSVLTQAHSHT